jgi:hypothetical protein
MTVSTDVPLVATTRRQRAPDFFIVGHPKCGTTALYEMLRHREAIFMPSLKEPQFFSREMRTGTRPARLPDTLDDYLALFAPARADQILGEASPSYLRSATAAALIAELQPAARVVAILREPASFLRSLHLQFLRNHVESERDFGKAISLEEARRGGSRMPRDSHRPADLFYSEHVRYVDQLRRYHAVLPREQVLVLIYDDFRADNEGTVRSVLRFLDVDDSGDIDVLDANPSVRLRSGQMENAVKGLPGGHGGIARAARVPVKALTSQRLRHGALRFARRRLLYTEPAAPDDILMRELRHRFKGEVVALGEYVGRDLVSLWGYGSID